MSCIKSLLYIDKKGDLSIIETGSINIKRSDRKYDYLLARVCNTDAYSLFIKNTADDVKMNLNDWCVIRHKIFKNIIAFRQKTRIILNSMHRACGKRR